MPEIPLVRVEQGPRWLVEFLMNPPWWFTTGMSLLGIAAAALVAYRLHQSGWRITPDQQWQMLGTSGVIVAVMTGVLAMANYTQSPYIVDVTIGFLAGYGAVVALDRIHVPFPIHDDRQRLTACWAILAASAFFLPVLAALNGNGTLLGASRYYLAVLGAAMAGYNELILPDILEADSAAG